MDVRCSFVLVLIFFFGDCVLALKTTPWVSELDISDSSNTDEVVAIARDIVPGWENLADVESIHLKPLHGGITNLLWRATAKPESWCLEQPDRVCRVLVRMYGANAPTT